MSNIPTPHIEAKQGDFAETVLMPGDPLRAKYIAENFLEDAVLVNSVRNMLGYTGFYKGKRVSVMGSGMGIPSIAIYSYELFKFYGVENIVRIGSCGAVSRDIKLKDVIIAEGASTDSAFATQYNLPGTFAPIASFDLLYKTYQTALQNNIPVKVGNVLSSDAFYSDNSPWCDMDILAVEMEAAGLYMNAAHLGKKALCLLTVSDLIYSDEQLSSGERQTGFDEMVTLALESAINY
ncbi:MAG: purine-nucleoside phosphorylase [Clostridia bacterium]|nr:purine-nucleoside phosphorylase [Clostridia bacterium]